MNSSSLKLRKPYQFILDLKKAKELEIVLRSTVKYVNARLDCTLVEKKSLARGMRFNVFLLAHSNNCSHEYWAKCTTEIKDLIQSFLGEMAKPYIENWTADRKFQLSFETYIQYTEMTN